MEEPAQNSVPAAEVINALIQVGAVTQAEVQMAAELVAARNEVIQLREQLGVKDD